MTYKIVFQLQNKNNENQYLGISFNYDPKTDTGKINKSIQSNDL